MASNFVKYEEIEKTQAISDTPELSPYTMEELNARIDEAEEQIARGELIDADEADREFEKMLALWDMRRESYRVASRIRLKKK